MSSTSPFIHGNSIWSNSGARPQSPQMPGSMSVGRLPVSESFNSDRSDTARLGPHPLPNRPPNQPLRSSSALSNRTATSEDHHRSFDSPTSHLTSKHGAIGSHRPINRGPSPAVTEPSAALNAQFGNNLAASVHSFRSANSASPLPSPAANDPVSSLGRQLFSSHPPPPLTASSNILNAGSPSSTQTASHPSRHASTSREAAELATPKLFLDNQHAFAAVNDQSPSFAVHPNFGAPTTTTTTTTSVSRNPTNHSGSSRPRPKSWMHPQSSDSSSQPLGARPTDQPFRSPNLEANPSNNARFANSTSSTGASGFTESSDIVRPSSSGYPFPASTRSALAASNRLSGHFESQLGSDLATNLAFDAETNLSTQNLAAQQHQLKSGLSQSRGGSPAVPFSAGPATFSHASRRGTPVLNLPPNFNLAGGLLSPTAATVGSMGVTPMLSPLNSPNMANPQSGFASQQQRQATPFGSMVDGSIHESGGAAFDQHLKSSPFLNELLERLNRVELGMKDFSRQVSGISRNVSLLLERTKPLPTASLGGASGANNNHAHGAAGSAGYGMSHDEFRSLNAQINALTNSVSHLLSVQGAAAAAGGVVMPPSPIAGLGLGGPSGMVGTPQLGAPPGVGLERSASPRIGTGPNAQFGPMINHPSSPHVLTGNPGAIPHDNLKALISPRPNAGGRGWNANGMGGLPKDDRRWNTISLSNLRKESLVGPVNPGLGLGPATAALEESARDNVNHPQQGTGLTNPNAIVTKWEHLNLHCDLLRSILKYGLGPPNKIQQRALPFLLRGNDIIAQAPPTQERIASYVIPALQLILNVAKENAASGIGTVASGFGGRINGGVAATSNNAFPPATKGPIALIISTTVDQATQAQRMALGLGAPLGIRVHIVAAASIDVQQEAQSLVQAWPHIVVGTPQKMSDLFTYLTNNAASLASMANGSTPISTAEIRLVVLDEVDQLIARNLADHVSSMLRVLPQPVAPVKAGGGGGGVTSPGLPSTPSNNNNNNNNMFSPFDSSKDGGVVAAAVSTNNGGGQPSVMDRQIALFSNTVPQDVLNFAQSIHLRESVRVLVRRDSGGPSGGGGGTNSAIHGNGLPTSASGGIGFGHGSGGNANAVGSIMLPQLRDGSQPPSNALGAHPINSSMNALNDPTIAALKGMRQYYLYVAVTSNGAAGGLTSPNPGLSSAANPASEMKLDLITDLLEDIDFGQAVVYCANNTTLEAIVYKLSSKGIEALGLTRDMNSYTRQQTLTKFRSPTSQYGTNNMMATMTTFAQPAGFTGVTAGSRARKALVVCDQAVNPKEVHQIPLVVFYDMPRSVEEYKDKITCAAAGALARPSVCVNVVTASGGPRGDVEMLRTLECHLGCKMAELPMDPKQILHF